MPSFPNLKISRDRKLPRLRNGAIFLLTGLHLSSASASDGVAPEIGVDLRWEAPNECPDAASVRAFTEHLLGQPLSAPRANNVRAQGKVSKNDAGNWELRLRLSVADRVEEETLIAKKCRALGDAMALKVALASDPFALVESVQRETSAPVAAELPANAAHVPSNDARLLPPPNGSSESRHVRASVRITGGAGVGQLPGVSGGTALYGSLQLSSFRAELGAQFYHGGDARYAQLPGVGAHLDLFSGTVRACFSPSAGRWTFPICSGLELGGMRGEGFGVGTREAASSLWGAAIVGPAVRVSLTRTFALWLEADAVLPFIRPGFHMANLDTLYVAPSSGSRASAGFEVDLWQ
jgi:hypothetical protein